MKDSILTCVCLLLCASFSRADEVPLFEKDIQPLFQVHCVRCHGEEKQRAELDLSSYSAMMKGSESGAIVVPGDPEKSLLFERVHDQTMPPGKNPKWNAAQQDLLKHWIEAGAKSSSASSSSEQITQHTIEPLLALRCTACHGLRKQEADLDLRTKETMLRGGKSGPVFVPGKPKESLILEKIHSGEMPPRDRLIRAGVKPMSETEIDTLAKWIADGAPEVHVEPDVATSEPDTLVTDKDREHWAFQPPTQVEVPEVAGTSHPIDAFLVRKLRQHKLELSPRADRLTLLRRATFDLTGLPPTPEEAQTFLDDPSPDAYEKLLDRLLDSPRYGERWGRYWLDLAGYADSEGKRSADPIRPHAWRYRDYVIRSFNDDKPYSQFLREQLAGDELVDYENAETITNDIAQSLVATGFLRMAPDGTGSDVVNYVPERLEVIADEIQVFGSAVLGLTLQCARCHSHKYDPIPHRDYYRLAAIFKGAFDEHDWLKPTAVKSQTKSSTGQRALAHLSEADVQKWKDYENRLKARIESLKKQKQIEGVKRQIRALENSLGSAPKIRALWDRGTPSATYIYRRGDYLQPTRLVGPGVPSVLTDGKTPFVVESPYPGAKSTGRRLALARWLTQPDHPLTSRVMVNRIWQHHFGRGIVESVSNFGKTGTPPTHPELLNWLARDFVGNGWKMKRLHRLIMTSQAYQQTSSVSQAHIDRDPDNRWLSRMPLRRLDAEEVRDSLLYVAGELDETRFGPPDLVAVRKDGLVTALRGENGWRRSIYVMHRRSQIPTILENFDLPQMNPNCTVRIQATVASQALHLLNNAHVEQLAAALAQRLRKASDHPSEQIEFLYWRAVSRPPSPDEKQLGLRALERLRQRWAQTNEEAASQRALTTYAHTVLNSAAFLYVD